MEESFFILKNIFNVGGIINGDAEFFEDIVRTPELLIERIVSTGQVTPAGEWYDQAKDEWVILVSGTAVIRFGTGTLVNLASGDHLFIPAHCKHRVEETSKSPPCFWIAIHGNLVSPANREFSSDNY